MLELNREQNTILVVVTHSPELATTFPQAVRMENGTLSGKVETAASEPDTVKLPPESGITL